MANFYDRRVRDDEFVQRVRRHAPSSLISTVASIAAQYPGTDDWLRSPYKKFTLWNLAEVARVSLVYGNEHRKPATEQDVLECCAAYTGISDPDLSHGPDIDAFVKFMLRMANEQLVYQVPVQNDMARAIAVLDQTQPARTLKVLTGDWAENLLGGTVADYVGVAFLLYVGALKTHGTFSLDWLDQESFVEINNVIPAEKTRQIAMQNFIASKSEIRQLQPALAPGAHPDTRRFGFNPLLARPVIKDLAEGLLVPVPAMLGRKVSLLGLYYTGVERWGTRFSQDLGSLFEAYIGRQLRLLPDADVYSAIKYGRDHRESVDWIVVFGDVTFLVEVKSTRPSESVRMGSGNAAVDLRKYLSRAVEQIGTTAKLIRDGNPAFRLIPRNNSIVGLVVTMEPFHIVNAPPYRELLPECQEPVVVCSAYELEGLVSLQTASAGQVLLNHVQDPSKQGWSVGSALVEHGHPENRILREAWERLPWAHGADTVAGSTANADKENAVAADR